MNNLVQFKNNQVTTTSVQIANTFGKKHSDVVRAINNIIGQLRKQDDFIVARSNIKKFAIERNFAPISYIDELNRKKPCYEITRDGFTLLAMGFTGAKALQFKLAYINAFNEMEAVIKQNLIASAPADMKAIGGMVKKCCAVAVRQELANLLAGDKTENWECSDQDLIYWLYRWHNTKSKAETLAFRQLHAERDALMAEITQLKEKAQQIKQLAIKL